MEDERPSVLSESGFKLSVLPLALVGLALSAFIPSYIVAVALGHLYPFWPYISDTGTTRPESCIFGFFLAWTGFMAAAAFYIRYKQVHLTLKGDGCCKIVNDLALLIGLLASIGMVLVAAFQENAVFQVHFTGAALAFGGGTIYIFMQTYLTSKLSEIFDNGKMVIIRFCYGMIALIAVIYMLANYAASYVFADGVNHLHWIPGDDGYVNHVCSTISEWIVALSFLLFMASFYKEFKSCKFEFSVCLRTNEQSAIFNTPQSYGTIEESGSLKV